MKHLIIVAALLSLGLAQDQPRYSCPEEFVTFRGNTISKITGVMSWEDCGAIYCNKVSWNIWVQIVRLWFLHRNNMQLVIRLPILELGSNWSGRF